MTRVTFVHIPKTAGTSIRTLLENRYTPEQICPGYWIDDQALLRRDEFPLVRAHVPLCALRSGRTDTQMVTFLRHPAERALSHYHHVCRDKFHFFHEAFVGLSFAQVLANETYRRFLSDMQVRFLGLRADQVTNMGQLEIETIKMDQDILDQALLNLNEFSFIGLTENIEHYACELQKKFDWWPLSKNSLKSNVNDYEKNQSHLEALEELNKFDNILYRAALDLISKRYGGEARSGCSQGMAHGHFEGSSGVDPVSAQPEIIWTKGFGLCEGDEQRRGSFKFFGSEHSAETCYMINPGDFCLYAEIIFAETPEHFRSFTISFNGIDLPREWIGLADGRTLFCARITPDMFVTNARGMNIVAFRSVPGVKRDGYLMPQSIGISGYGFLPASAEKSMFEVALGRAAPFPAKVRETL